VTRLEVSQGHQTNPGQRSLEVTESGTIRLIGYGFL